MVEEDTAEADIETRGATVAMVIATDPAWILVAATVMSARHTVATVAAIPVTAMVSVRKEHPRDTTITTAETVAAGWMTTIAIISAAAVVAVSANVTAIMMITPNVPDIKKNQ